MALETESVQRLDEDTWALAMQLPSEMDVPPEWRNRPVVLLNGFYTKLQEDFERRGCVALWIQRGPSVRGAWEELRSQYAGRTNPFQAAPQTVRGDAARGILEVETVSILANVIHLSADETEGRREVEQVWWQPHRYRKLFA